MKRYLIVIEKGEDNYSAYCPDLPGCVATGSTVEETEKNIYEAIEFHLEGMKEDKLILPESTAIAEYMAFQA
jgi:predicted RNase H-like HicB family nuclease